VAVTLKLAFPPLLTLRLVGCWVIVAGMRTVSRALLLATEPAGL